MRSTRHFSAAITNRSRVALLASITVVLILAACEPSGADADDNEKIMEDAARSLSLAIPGNRVYMLEKTSGAAALPGVRSKVAVLFGYGDNGSICKKIAGYLMEQPGARGGQYECNAID